MAGFPNSQSNPGSAIPVYTVAPGAVTGLKFLGYEQITDLSSVKGFTLPLGIVNLAIVAPEAGNVRWRGDGTNPTNSVGMPLWATSTQPFSGDLSIYKFINMTDSTAKLNIAYYGVAP